MRILKKDLRHGLVTVAIQSPDDLWYVSQIVRPGDAVRSKTERKIRLGDKDKSKSAVRRTVTVSLRVETVDFAGNLLRASGKINAAPDEIPKGVYHTITVQEGSVLTIIKQSWGRHEMNRLKEAATQKHQRVLIVVFDREQAIFAVVNAKGYEVLAELKGDVRKKRIETSRGENFYKKIISAMQEYVKRYKAERVILASPAFWNEELLKELDNPVLSRKIVKASCSSVGKQAIEEVIRRPELKEVLHQWRAAKESGYVDSVMKEIRKGGLVAYGPKEVKNAVSGGAVATLLITTDTISKSRECGFEKLECLMKTVETMKGEVVIINSENDAGKQLDGLGGEAALLRYKLNY